MFKIMKRIIYITAICLLAINIQAQVTDRNGLQTFLDELKALDCEHVECTNANLDNAINDSSTNKIATLNLSSDIVLFNVGGKTIPLSSIKKRNPDFRFLQIESLDETGYNLISETLNKYHNAYTEDIFGIPIMASLREDGEEQTIFMNDKNTLLIRDGDKDIEIIYGSFNLMDIAQFTLKSIINVFDEEYVDVEMFGGINFSIHTDDIVGFGRSTECKSFPSAEGNEIMQFARKTHENKIELLEKQLLNTENEEKREKLEEELSELREEQSENLEKLEEKLDKLEYPGFIEIEPGSDTHFVAIPKVPAELKEKMKPYAINGVYDWINSTGFNKGASMLNFDQISCIITPRDVAMQYVIRHFSRNKWFDEGFTKEYKERAAVEYQGGTPAILYRFSQNEKGYNEMMNDLSFLFNCKQGEKKFNLEVIQQSRRNGKRFVQLYGEGNILMCLFDSPEDKYCHMSIIIGGISGFEQAVNEYIFGGVKDIAKKCNIIIDSNLSDNSYGIHFNTVEYFHAGKMHRNGVHIDFGYFERFTK